MRSDQGCSRQHQVSWLHAPSSDSFKKMNALAATTAVGRFDSTALVGTGRSQRDNAFAAWMTAVCRIAKAHEGTGCLTDVGSMALSVLVLTVGGWLQTLLGGPSPQTACPTRCPTQKRSRWL